MIDKTDAGDQLCQFTSTHSLIIKSQLAQSWSWASCYLLSKTTPPPFCDGFNYFVLHWHGCKINIRCIKQPPPRVGTKLVRKLKENTDQLFGKQCLNRDQVVPLLLVQFTSTDCGRNCYGVVICYSKSVFICA